MKKNRELDASVARNIFGWTNVRCNEGGNVPYGEPNDDYNQDNPTNRHREEVPLFSSTWEGLGMVMEEMIKKGFKTAIISYSTKLFQAFMAPVSGGPAYPNPERVPPEAKNSFESPGEAVCVTALEILTLCEEKK